MVAKDTQAFSFRPVLGITKAYYEFSAVRRSEEKHLWETVLFACWSALVKVLLHSLRTAFLLIDNIVISLKDGGLQSWDSGAELAVGGPTQQRALLCPPAAVLRRAAGCGICDERSAPSFVLSLQHSLFSQSLRLWDDFTIDRADWAHHLYRYPWL